MIIMEGRIFGGSQSVRQGEINANIDQIEIQPPYRGLLQRAAAFGCNTRVLGAQSVNKGDFVGWTEWRADGQTGLKELDFPLLLNPTRNNQYIVDICFKHR